MPIRGIKYETRIRFFRWLVLSEHGEATSIRRRVETLCLEERGRDAERRGSRSQTEFGNDRN